MRVRASLMLLGAALLASSPARALDEPVVWRDETGCAYLLTPQGGIAPRFRRDGAPDCPDAAAGRGLLSAPLVSDQAVREIQRGLEALRRDLDRLGDRLRR